MNARKLIPIVLCALPPVLLAGCKPATRPAATRSAGQRPNVVFILVDTLRADRLGCYGDQRRLAPLFDEVAAEGVLFERVIAQSPWTLPSVASYFCGLYPTVHKVTSYEAALRSARSAGSVRYFSDQFTTLAEILRDHGYQTAGFSANPFVTAKFGFAQGFEHFDSSFASNDTRGDVVNQAALRWLEQRDPQRPFFLYLHYMDVHDPYKADAKYVEPLIAAVEQRAGKRKLTQAERKRHVRYFAKSARAYQTNPRHRALFAYADYWVARYDSGVGQINEFLDVLRRRLQGMGLWDDAFVILVSDHGEALGEHHIWAHGLSAHQDQLHVPLILRWPGHLPAGRRIAQTVRLFDLMPTLLEEIGLPVPGGLQARSLAPLIRGEGGQWPPALAEAVKEAPQNKVIVQGPWKLLAWLDRNRFELYNLDDDPHEQTNLADHYPDRVAQLRALLDAQLAENQRLGRGIKATSREISAQERRRFQALGYLEEDHPPASQPQSQPHEPPPD